MTLTGAMVQRVQALPPSEQQEVLDFEEFLESGTKDRLVRGEDTPWYDFSLASPMRGMEEEYSPSTDADLMGQAQPCDRSWPVGDAYCPRYRTWLPTCASQARKDSDMFFRQAIGDLAVSGNGFLCAGTRICPE